MMMMMMVVFGFAAGLRPFPRFGRSDVRILALGKGAAKRARRLAQTDNLVLFVLGGGGG